jgi:hypothetical protein
MYGRKPQLPLVEGITPLEEVKTYEARTWMDYLNKHLPVIHQEAISNIQKAQQRQKQQYDKRSGKPITFNKDELVLRKNNEKTSFPKLRWTGPWKIIKATNETKTAYLVKHATKNHKTTVNVSNLRKYNKRLEEGERCNDQMTTHYN